MINIIDKTVNGQTATKLKLSLVGYKFTSSYKIYYAYYTAANALIKEGNLNLTGSHISSTTNTNLQSALTAAVGTNSNAELSLWAFDSDKYKFFYKGATDTKSKIIAGAFIPKREADIVKQFAFTNLGVSEIITSALVSQHIAYTWFGRKNTAYSAGRSWIGVTKDIVAGTFQHIIEYQESGDFYSETLVGTVADKDDHNQPSILVRSSDSKLLIAYTEHNAAQIRLRISTTANSAASFTSEYTIQPSGASSRQYDYPHLYQITNGDIILIYRLFLSGTGHSWCYTKSTDGGSTWGLPTEFYKVSTTAQAYIVPAQSDIDANIIHFVATDKHPQHLSFAPTSIYHFYFNASSLTFYKSDGTDITSLLNLQPSEITAVSIFTSPDSSWMDDITVVNGLPRIIYTKYPNGVNTSLQIKELWFTEWTGLAWSIPYKIAQTLNGYMEQGGTISEYAYIPAARFDLNNRSIIWAGIQVSGILEIHRVTRFSSSYFSIEQISFNSVKNNWRPIIIEGSAIKNVLWMRMNTYNSYTDYDMDLITITN